METHDFDIGLVYIIYYEINKTADFFLKAEDNPIEILREFNPSFDELAKRAKSIADKLNDVINKLEYSESRIHSNIKQAVCHMEQISNAILNGNKDSLYDGFNKLRNRTLI